LKQIGLATHDYHDQYKKLPPGQVQCSYAEQAAFGGYGGYGTALFGTLPFILPYIEQASLYNTLNPSPQVMLSECMANGANGWPPEWWTIASWQLASTAVIPQFQCPSDFSWDAPSGGAACTWMYCWANPAGGGGIEYGIEFGAAQAAALNYNGAAITRSNYASCAGSLGGPSGGNPYNIWMGVFTTNSHVTLQNITDGTSNSLFFGETLFGNGPGSVRDVYASWVGLGGMCTAWGLPAKCTWNTFGSAHQGVVNFCFADGSVRTIKTGVGTTFFTPDWYDLSRLAGMQDQGVFNWESFE